MNYTRFILTDDGYYSLREASNIEMTILGYFFNEIGRKSSFREWALASVDGDGCGINIIQIENDNDFILLEDETSDEPIPTKFKATKQQFVQLMDEWREAIAKESKQILIKHEYGDFFFEISDERDPSAKALPLPDKQFCDFLDKKFEVPHAKITMTAYDDTYLFMRSSGAYMSILGDFFATDIGHTHENSFRHWALTSANGDNTSGKYLKLKREFDDILLIHDLDDEPVITQLRIAATQLVQLIDEWQEKVVKVHPRGIVIKYEDGAFSIETTDWKPKLQE